MRLFESILYNPVKVAVAVLLLVMFGLLASARMPMQLAPDVERPMITIRTAWPGASPMEVEKEIIDRQEELLKGVAGVLKMTSESMNSMGSISLEFQVGTNMNEALLRVNSQLQQVRQYPIDAQKPVISLASSSGNSIAWFILGARPPTAEQIDRVRREHPELSDELDHVFRPKSVGLSTSRLHEFTMKHGAKYPLVEELVPPKLDVAKLRKFVEDTIEAAFERVDGVADAVVRGGELQQLNVIVDPSRLAARGLTLSSVRDALLRDNQDVSAGDFWEGNRRWVVRVLGRFLDEEHVANQILTSQNGLPVYLRDVADVELGYAKPTGYVRRYGVPSLSVSIDRETGSNVYEVMRGLRRTAVQLNEGVLKNRNLVISQVYDETEYISSAINLVNQNIIVGSALTVITLMLFLHIGTRSLVWVPMLAASAVMAVAISPWFFLVTLALILAAGFWFARGTLVVAIAIPTSIIGTFLILNLQARSLNVISLAGLAFAVGMLVDNAVVVLENIFRHQQLGRKPFDAAVRGVTEVWGAVLASTLTTLAVFLPVVFLQGEAGQLFADIALAISAAVGLSLLVSVLVIPTASARIIDETVRADSKKTRKGSVQRFLENAGSLFSDTIVGINQWIQRGFVRRVVVALGLVAIALLTSWLLMPNVEYLPGGNRNLVICNILLPPGYNPEHLGAIGAEVEERLKPFWDIDAEQLSKLPPDYPAIDDFFYVAREGTVFLGLRAQKPENARFLIDLVQSQLGGRFPGAIVNSFQTSLFGRGMSGARTIDIEISGPHLETLVEIGADIMAEVRAKFPDDTQARAFPGLDLSSPEIHVTAKSQQIGDLGLSNAELGFIVNTLVDGAYIGDYFIGGERIDVVLMGSREYRRHSQEIGEQYIAIAGEPFPIRLNAIADILKGSGPEQIQHRNRERAITISVTPSPHIPLEKAIDTINKQIIAPMREDGRLESEYKTNLSGTADKLQQTWEALRWNFLLALMITYLLMAALFESWAHPFVIILSVPIGAVGGIVGLRCLGLYLSAQGIPTQSLDVLTMLGFIILIGIVVNNAILLVHQSLVFMREDQLKPQDAVISSIRARIRPIFMTTFTTVFGLSPLVFFPGAGSELYRGLGSVVLGGLLVSTFVTLFLVPTTFTLMADLKATFARLISAVNQGPRAGRIADNGSTHSPSPKLKDIPLSAEKTNGEITKKRKQLAEEVSE
ncbi:MAG TPA: efflux RND transporter permease subunit [Pirellulaceae bacterium]|nr:efflux RND transporter permease subunit [Pirellulaceae bacterium]HMO93248.1 efflux RND transporter permease subunit [Pirellulaceae bacterium]HMP69113.1 efflux RND transporter permease subunit [Pirellulaceae bacterium]